jgi:ribosomal protein S18 acetylase RimI-like enzyme
MGAIAAAVCRRPRSLQWVIDGWRGPRGRYDEGAPELTYLAVASRRRRGGIGRRLVEAFTVAMTSKGASAYELSVDDDNASAVEFYENLGFRLVGQYRQFDGAHRRYRLASSIGSPPCP